MNPKKMLAMYGMPMGFETAVAEGGGGAAAPTSAPATGGIGGGAPSGGRTGGEGSKSGFFHNLDHKDLTPAVDPAAKTPEASGEPKTPEPGKAPETGKVQVLADDGKTVMGEFDSEEAARAFIETEKTKLANAGKTPEEIAAAAATGAKITPESVLEKPIYGRFKTIAETEAGIKRMETEGVRLAAENKKLKADSEKALATREAEVAAMKAEIELARKTPPFVELTEEQEEALGKESPAKLVKYHLAKRDQNDSMRRAKETAAKEVQDRQARFEAINAEIQRHDQEMRADPINYPMFEEVNPLMASIHDVTGGDNSPLRGQAWANEFYYLASLGVQYRTLLKKGAVAKATATTEVKTAAAAAAQVTGAAGGGAAGGVKTPAKKDDAYETWSKGVDAAAPKKFLNFKD